MKQTTADKNITNSAERKVIVNCEWVIVNCEWAIFGNVCLQILTGDKGLGTFVTSKSLVPSPKSLFVFEGVGARCSCQRP